MPCIRVLNQGYLTTVQDRGRRGSAHIGVPQAGAADSVALRLGNRLVGNGDDAAALETTLVGGAFELDDERVVAVSGAACAFSVDAHPVPMWTSLKVSPRQVLSLGPLKQGARSYLCIAGGIDVPPLLGSRSTQLSAGFGGFLGRALRKGDMLPTGTAPASDNWMPSRVDPDMLSALYADVAIRITEGPQIGDFLGEAAASLGAASFSVREESNRVGLRLSGPTLPWKEEIEMLTEGVSVGAVQVPRDGNPILLFVEHPTTGGYPKIANVISADLHRVGQLRPRDTVRFEWIAFERAVDLLRKQEAMLSTAPLIAPA